MGYGLKCNQKKIDITPGPADYIDSQPRTTTGVGANACIKISQNYALNNGGLKKPKLFSEKEELIAKAFARSQSSREINGDLGKVFKGFNGRSSAVQISGYAQSLGAPSVHLEEPHHVKDKISMHNQSDDLTMAMSQTNLSNKRGGIRLNNNFID